MLTICLFVETHGGLHSQSVLFSRGRKGNFYLTMHLTYFIYGYMASDIWREETHCCHYMGYFIWLAARDLLYPPSHRQNSTYHSLCYTSCGALVGTRNSSMGAPWGIDLTTHSTISGCYTMELHLTPIYLPMLVKQMPVDMSWALLPRPAVSRSEK